MHILLEGLYKTGGYSKGGAVVVDKPFASSQGSQVLNPTSYLETPTGR